MISHKYKCIFIHISKCAGSNIERSFGINTSDNSENNNINLFGWCKKNKLYLQHATPEQLLNFKYITYEQWSEYYKFIIIRNPWSRALSDYLWISQNYNLKDTFYNFIKRQGKYKKILSEYDKPSYRGDHLNNQSSYFFINGKEVKYDKVIRLENYNEEIKDLKLDKELVERFLINKTNIGKNTPKHYSFFYNKKRKKLIEKTYKIDIDYFNYYYEEKKTFLQKIKSNLNSKYYLNNL